MPARTARPLRQNRIAISGTTFPRGDKSLLRNFIFTAPRIKPYLTQFRSGTTVKQYHCQAVSVKWYCFSLLPAEPSATFYKPVSNRRRPSRLTAADGDCRALRLPRTAAKNCRKDKHEIPDDVDFAADYREPVGLRIIIFSPGKSNNPPALLTTSILPRHKPHKWSRG